jgi:AbrB family looped-hinge helix DNA binding protein
MKHTGVVRRIDDLGRIVIPKEIRRNFKIKEGDPLEISTDGKYICFSKYMSTDMSQDSEFAQNLYKMCSILYGPFGVDLYDLDHTLIYGSIQNVAYLREIPISVNGDHIGYLNVPVEATNEDNKVNKIAEMLYNSYNL